MTSRKYRQVFVGTKPAVIYILLKVSDIKVNKRAR